MNCANCGRPESVGGTFLGNFFVCHHCEIYYYACDHCGNVVHYSAAHYCPCGYKTYCSMRCLLQSNCSCGASDDYDEDDSECGLHDYHGKTRPNLVFHGAEYDYMYYGLELETDGYPNRAVAVKSLRALSDNETLFHLERDGSLSSRGIEIIFQPRSLNSWVNFLDELTAITECAKSLGGKAYSQAACGAHVHRSNHDITDDVTASLIAFFGLNRRRIEMLAQRPANTYCQFNSVFRDFSNIKTYVKHEHHKDERRSTINFQNPYTIEFRCFKATLNPRTLLAYIQFADAVVAFAKTTSIDELIKFQRGWRDFINFIESDPWYSWLWHHLYKTKLL